MRLYNAEASTARVADLIEEYEQKSATGDFELEVRFGSLRADGSFASGVDAATFAGAENLLLTNPQALKASARQEIHDFFFQVHGIEHRHRSVFDTDYLRIERQVVSKRRVRSVIVPHSLGAFRVSLSHEKPVDESLVPDAVNTSCVRIQQRRTFRYVPDGATRCLCQYDLGQVFQGTSKSEAEQAQSQHAGKLELELEFCDPSYFKRHGRVYGAQSVLMKACDMYCVSEVDFAPGEPCQGLDTAPRE